MWKNRRWLLLQRGICRLKMWWMYTKCYWWQLWCLSRNLFQLSSMSRLVQQYIGFWKVILRISFQTANVILRVPLLWNVIAMVIALAEKDLQAQNVMNVYQMSSVTSVTHVNQASSIIHLVKKVVKIDQTYIFLKVNCIFRLQM